MAPDDVNAWQARHALYWETAATGAVPSPARLAALLEVPTDAAWAALEDLERRRIVMLDHGRRAVVMAHPFSGVETPWVVHAAGRRFFANCAWDTLGVAAALGTDAAIEGVYAEDGHPARLSVGGGDPAGEGVIHLLLPPRHWQEDFYAT